MKLAVGSSISCLQILSLCLCTHFLGADNACTVNSSLLRIMHLNTIIFAKAGTSVRWSADSKSKLYLSNQAVTFDSSVGHCEGFQFRFLSIFVAILFWLW